MGLAGSDPFYADYVRDDPKASTAANKGAVLDYQDLVEFVSEATVAELKVLVETGELGVDEVVEAEAKGKKRAGVLALKKSEDETEVESEEGTTA